MTHDGRTIYVCAARVCRRPGGRVGSEAPGAGAGTDGSGVAAAAAAAAVDRRRPVHRRMVQPERVRPGRQIVLRRHRAADAVERHDRVLHGHGAVLRQVLPARHHVGHLFETRRHE